MTETEDTKDQLDPGQSLISHLIELRRRLLNSVIAVFVIFLPLLYYANEIYTYVSGPLRVHMTGSATMIATQVASPLLAPLKLAMVLAAFLAIPFILHQVWSFVAPGLYRREKHFALPLLISSIILFYCGIAFAFYVVFPLIFGFFAQVVPEGVTVMTDINSYLDFILGLFFAFGITFEIPIATVLLVWSGITDVESLASKRSYIIVGCFTVGMVLTPPDVVSQCLLSIPMWILFELGLVLCRFLPIARKDEQPGSG